jgi:hypothetical protein
MNHLLTVVGVIAVATALAAVVYRAAGRVAPWRAVRSALAGLAVAAALTAWVATVRHAALVHSAAQPMSSGQELSPGSILADGFIGTFVVAAAAVFAITAVASSRRARRAARQDGAPAGRRPRRAAVRGW